ncbi:MAG: GNAT family N-acetyltransferase, partial [Cyanobacteria bacterium REEB65]|nr:GNAT family N-acetyltransferase [Cyanobacteria bacterium REEB65]
RRGIELTSQFGRWQQVYPLVRALALFPNPYQHLLNLHVAECQGTVAGFIQTSPGNQSRSRWHIDYLAVAPPFRGRGIAKALLDYIFARYAESGVQVYTLQIDARNQAGLALCGEKGFRHYATVGYYQASADLLATFQPVPPPNKLRPIRKSDSTLLADLYIASTPAPVRLVDSRSPADYEAGLIERSLELWRRRMRECEETRYVVDGPNRELVGYLRILAQYRGIAPHTIQLTVHPGYAQNAGDLLRFALGKLRGYPPGAALTWCMQYHPYKQQAFEEAGLQRVTEDICLVKDGTITLKLPASPYKPEELPAFKPAYCEPMSRSAR